MIRALAATLCLTTAAAADSRVPGQSVFGQNNYTEYVPGDLPIVISAPHGGRETPGSIPDRTSGVTDSDANTQELARTIAEVVHSETGHHVHLIICRLHRRKLDANREIAEAAQGSPAAVQAWTEHHAFIEEACTSAVKRYGKAFLIDLHGHGHPDPRLELGYLHSAMDLADCEDRLNGPSFVRASSLRMIAEQGKQPYTDLIRGPTSLGALMEARGFPSTPSPRMPVPTEPYFRGGYTISRHCNAEQHIAGLQIEANRPRLRDTADNRLRFSRALVDALKPFLACHLGLEIGGGKTPAAGWPCYSLRQVPPHIDAKSAASPATPQNAPPCQPQP